MDKVRPLISVIVPCYNQGKYLSESLNSVLHQTYTNWECIVVNDGSTDDSEAIALAYTEKDNRFKYFKHENSGLSATRNVGLNLANGEWIQFLDADDYISPDKFKISINVISQYVDAKLIVCNFKMFVSSHLDYTPPFCEIRQEYLSFDNILYKWGDFVIPIHCGLFKSCLFELTKFNEDLKALEDWIMWLDIFKGDPTAIYFDTPLAYYRNNPTSMTKDKLAFRNNLIIAYKYIVDHLGDSEVKKFSKIIIDRLYVASTYLYEDIERLKQSPFYKFEQAIKKTLRKPYKLLKKLIN